MKSKKVFVTVGTTKFPKLVNTIISKEILETFISKGYNFIQIQTGKEFNEIIIDPNILPTPTIKTEGTTKILNIYDKLIVKYDPYFENFGEEIESSDLIISHAGAGSCLEILQKGKPLIVVVNKDLMDNHQTELAEQLQNEGYVYHCTCSTLTDAVKQDLSTLKVYPKSDVSTFSDYLDKCMGFSA